MGLDIALEQGREWTGPREPPLVFTADYYYLMISQKGHCTFTLLVRKEKLSHTSGSFLLFKYFKSVQLIFFCAGRHDLQLSSFCFAIVAASFSGALVTGQLWEFFQTHNLIFTIMH